MATETIDQKRIRFVEELLKATRQGRLAWHDTAEDEMYRTLLPHGMVRIHLGNPLGPILQTLTPERLRAARPCWIHLLDRQANEIDVISVNPDSPNYRAASELYDLSRGR